MISTNATYHKWIDKHKWMEERVIKIWDFCKPIVQCCHEIKVSFCFRLMLRAKVFIWRFMVRALALGGCIKQNKDFLRIVFLLFGGIET